LLLHRADKSQAGSLHKRPADPDIAGAPKRALGENE
jgi:hypothetical protein